MGGFVQSVSKFMNSTPGRVLTGIATGGTSELVRGGVTLAEKHLDVDPSIARPVGAVLGATASPPLGVAGPTATGAGSTASTGTATDTPKGAGSSPPAVTSGAAKLASPGPIPVTNPTLGTPIIQPTPPGPQTAEEELASRRRAFAARRALGDTSTRASEQLTGSLG